jgi:hypothetical protein
MKRLMTTLALGFLPPAAAGPDLFRVGRRFTVLVFGLALTAACATSPEDIAPAPVSEARYQDWTCAELTAEQARVGRDLAAATAKQEQTRSSDVAGVILLGLPLGSMSGDDVEPEIARLKGERDALGRSAKTKDCDLAAAAAGSATGPMAPIRKKGRLTEAELRWLLPGAVLRGTAGRGNNFIVTYNRDGTLDGLSGSDSDTGDWTIEGDTVCSRWRKWRNGERRCFYFMKDGERYAVYFTGTNELNATASISRG